jgi:maleate cis-trans isomerase
LAFAHALRALGLHKVAVAATYPAEVATLFVDFLSAGGIEAAKVTSHEIRTAAEVGTLSAQRLLDIANGGDHDAADAILLPDTAFHTAAHLELLEQRLGKPVLTANQVTVWEALRLVQAPVHRVGLGRLFRDAIAV